MRAMSPSLMKKDKKSKNHRNGPEMLIGDDTPFAVTEAYKTLRTNLLFTAAALEANTPHKNAFVVTSPVPN